MVKSVTVAMTITADRLVMPGNSAIIASRIKGTRLDTLDGLGHRAIWESPGEMAPLVGAFLTLAPAATP